MKAKTVPVGQLIIDGLGETENAYDYVHELMPLIGEVVLWFNTLESDIDDILCGFISDRTDQKGLLVVGNMMFATKLDLFERLTSDFFVRLATSPPGIRSFYQTYESAAAYVIRLFTPTGCTPMKRAIPK